MSHPRPHLLNLPLARPVVTATRPQDRASIQIYRPFFVAGIVTVLTVGCLLGALALFGISQQMSYTTSVWTPYVLAHANSQLFGWVGFFVMGFALQQHSPSNLYRRTFELISYWSLSLMSIGIVLRFLAEPLVAADPEKWMMLGILSGAFQIGAVGMFLHNTTVHRHRTGKPMTWPTWFVFGSLAWLLVISLADPIAFVQSHQSNEVARLDFIARWGTPIREAQFLGFAAMMIFGVASSKFQGCLGFLPTSASWGKAAFITWTAGLVLRIIGWSSAMNVGLEPGSDLLFRIGGAALALGALMIAIALRLFEPARETNASQKFIRSGFAWLLVAGVMLVLEPIHLAVTGQVFSHAYTGAIRHAVTVGFISQMIIGVGWHLVTKMASLDHRNLPTLTTVWVLLNVGNLLRVGLEVGTDFSAASFIPMGFTGFIELVGLAIWATQMIKVIARRSVNYAAVC